MLINNELTATVRDILDHEAVGNLEECNIQARLFFNRMPAVRRIEFGIGIYVETWWDPESENWITEAKDTYGNDLLPPEFTGHVNDASIAHIWMLHKAINGFEAL